ncbi:LysE family translocator [Marinomonas transparens]|uniref:LysE family translocator n=1 Tax=Marinomonas transparens TaxID=2795388 RepID=A0A934JR55_9GAMM|nr:LysE family translocator [Marinomonas transparens]MBJ7538544.1 LysE family translocator [Marinomonas transparens]
MLSLLSIALAFFVIAASPGPANIANATIAMSQGRKVSLIYGAGLSVGLIFWGIVAASGLGVVLQNSVYLLMVLKVFGGLYLIWLAFLSAKDAMHPTKTNLQINTAPKSYLNWFMKGVVLNISNPKSVIAWMAALSVGLGANDNTMALVSGVIVCVVVGFIVNGLYSVLFSFSGVMSWYQKANRWINGVVAGLFTLAGFGLIRSAFNRGAP